MGFSLGGIAKAAGGAIGGYFGGPGGAAAGMKIGDMLGGAGDSALDFVKTNASSAAQLAAAKYGYDKTYKGVQETNKTNLQLVAKNNQSAKAIADQANKLSQMNAREQMEFQNQQSSTAHQREIVDLKAAGLNPILSGTGGMGASAGSGASGSVVAAPTQAGHVENATGAAVSSAMNMMQTIAQTMKTNADREFLQTAQTEKTKADTGLSKEQAKKTQHETVNIMAQNHQIRSSTQKILQETKNLKTTQNLTKMQTIKVQSEVANIKEQFKHLKMNGDISASEYGRYMELARRATENIGNLPSLLKAIKGFRN